MLEYNPYPNWKPETYTDKLATNPHIERLLTMLDSGVVDMFMLHKASVTTELDIEPFALEARTLPDEINTFLETVDKNHQCNIQKLSILFSALALDDKHEIWRFMSGMIIDDQEYFLYLNSNKAYMLKERDGKREKSTDFDPTIALRLLDSFRYAVPYPSQGINDTTKPYNQDVPVINQLENQLTYFRHQAEKSLSVQYTPVHLWPNGDSTIVGITPDGGNMRSICFYNWARIGSGKPRVFELNVLRDSENDLTQVLASSRATAHPATQLDQAIWSNRAEEMEFYEPEDEARWNVVVNTSIKNFEAMFEAWEKTHYGQDNS